MNVNSKRYSLVYSIGSIRMTTTVFDYEAIRKVPPSSRERSTSRVNEIYESLVSDIIKGTIPPGESLSELSLAERFKVSRTPVREVLIHLHKEGFAQRRPSKGFVVSEISLESIKELFFVRMLLEPAAAKLAARNPEVITSCKELEQIHIRMQEIMRHTIDFDDTLELAELDYRFHSFIGQASGNKKLASFVAEIMNQFRRALGCYQNRTWDAETLEEHKTILDAIIRQDPDAAEQCTLLHLRKSIGRAKVLFAEMLGDDDLL